MSLSTRITIDRETIIAMGILWGAARYFSR